MKLSLPDISIRRCFLPLAAALMLPISASHADVFTLTGALSGALESPATPSPGTGQATIILNTTTNMMAVSETFSGLAIHTRDHNTVRHDSLAHPLLPGFSVPDRRNVGVATTTPTFPLFPWELPPGPT